MCHWATISIATLEHLLIIIMIMIMNSTVHLFIINSFIYPTDAQIDCCKQMLKFTLKFT